ncbi:acyl-CoA N-acyltransferase [Punctularia strigosozonata HHB-11173 SS5]|uniref:Glucosamine 6-phosphate N-acetyltransferase n=1 Tax=Punctularia strigosozonata (strain HHB-11173) TaxID=741275 RepID=R7S2X9_PUNST|nr:acyl-CoA N-acyltransferase [Punctularia strigosozonata HHB-11173 SS5]EIN04720.1 acyl-CoA N-acyltransferase [Punctularia strigosozonata HHB-11173 SS5]
MSKNPNHMRPPSPWSVPGVPSSSHLVITEIRGMPFTPDEELDLAFDPSLISPDVKSKMPPDLHIRPLASTDYHRGYLTLLSVLTTTPDPGEAAFVAQFNAMRETPRTYFPIVVVSKASDRIIANGTLFIERKFAHNTASVGHLEEGVVAEDYQGKKLGPRVFQALTYVSESLGCYKTILNCSDKNVRFYENCGMVKKGNEMVKYAPERTHTPKL